MSLHVIVLAAGRGQRMANNLPKVLHPVAGIPMLARTLKSLSHVPNQSTRVVVGASSHIVSSVAGKFKTLCFQQKNDVYGTAQAVMAAKTNEITDGDVLIINGDHPLISPENLINFIQTYKKLSVDCAVGSFKIKGENQAGRLLFKGDQLIDIVEHYEVKKRKIISDFTNAGIYIIKASILNKYLNKISKNIKEEYPLTDLISILHKNNHKVRAIDVPWNVAFGVNNQRELVVASAIAFENSCYKHLDNGVVIIDFKNTYIEEDVVIGKGSLLYPGVHLRGKTHIGSFCAIESNSYIFDSIIKNYVNIKAGSYIEGSVIGEKSVIGPYAHLRPDSVIGQKCRIGNFVETKKIKMDDHSKAAHLSYLGDTEIGKNVNIGCGTVTCNYGVDKQKRKIKMGNSVFVGSGSQLIAPLDISDNVVIGAGSVITKNIPKDNLGIARVEQKNLILSKKSNKK